MALYVQDAVHIIRSAYPGITEREILWDHDMHWVHNTIRRIQTDERERRRWNLDAMLAAALPTAFGADKSAGQFYQQLRDLTISDEEREAEWQAHQDEMKAALDKQNRETIERWKAKEAQEKAESLEQHDTFVDPESGVVVEMDSL